MAFKIIVCAKQVPDTNVIKINPKTGTLIRDGVPSILNHDDNNALEEALKIKDKYNKFNVYNPNAIGVEAGENVSKGENIDHETKTDVQIALSKLNTKDRMIVSLCVVEGYKSSEVAEILSMNSSTVRSRLNRSLKKMREYLEVE